MDLTPDDLQTASVLENPDLFTVRLHEWVVLGCGDWFEADSLFTLFRPAIRVVNGVCVCPRDQSHGSQVIVTTVPGLSNPQNCSRESA